MHGDATRVRALLKSGANVDAQDSTGYTALMYAKNEEVARVLLDHGADTSISELAGGTAYDIADDRKVKALLQNYAQQKAQEKEFLKQIVAQYKHLSTAQERFEFLRNIREHGASDPEIVKFLKSDSEIFPEECDKSGQTLLHFVASENVPSFVRLLLHTDLWGSNDDKAKYVNTQIKKTKLNQTNAGKTALMIASEHGYVSVVRELLLCEYPDQVTDVNISDEAGNKAYDLAKNYAIKTMISESKSAIKKIDRTKISNMIAEYEKKTTTGERFAYLCLLHYLGGNDLHISDLLTRDEKHFPREGDQANDGKTYLHYAGTIKFNNKFKFTLGDGARKLDFIFGICAS